MRFVITGITQKRYDMIKVISPGMYTTIQDLGRYGYAKFGVPFSGAMDRYSAILANHILGNKLSDAILEITLGNVTLLIEKKLVIVISGADTSIKINNESAAINKTLMLKNGDVLSMKEPVYGVRTYLAVKGGFQSEKVMGSRSYYKNITERFVVQKGDQLPSIEENILKPVRNASVKISKDHFTNKVVEVFKGPEYDLLSEKQKSLLETSIFTISKDNNRMGYRLVEKIENRLSSMLTSSVLPGTVQLTPGGNLIVLMRDCQVTGGYPRVLQLTDNAINRLAQKSTNDTFQFKLVDLAP